MIDVITIKRHYIRYWVDCSQAARKAAEELAKKDTASLRDKYKPQNVIMTLNGKRVEFKGENEKKHDGDIYFTYDEVKKCFGEPDSDGWRLPTKEELGALCKCPYKFEEDYGQCIFDNRLYLLAAGVRYCDGRVMYVGLWGEYWSSTSKGSDYVWLLYFDSDVVGMYDRDDQRQRYGFSVRLVRDVK